MSPRNQNPNVTPQSLEVAFFANADRIGGTTADEAAAG
jgi:hypothetical protein